MRDKPCKVHYLLYATFFLEYTTYIGSVRPGLGDISTAWTNKTKTFFYVWKAINFLMAMNSFIQRGETNKSIILKAVNHLDHFKEHHQTYNQQRATPQKITYLRRFKASSIMEVSTNNPSMISITGWCPYRYSFCPKAPIWKAICFQS